jgi:hypothetical protein
MFDSHANDVNIFGWINLWELNTTGWTDRLGSNAMTPLLLHPIGPAFISFFSLLFQRSSSSGTLELSYDSNFFTILDCRVIHFASSEIL